MSTITAFIRNEPVRFFVAVQTLVTLAATGLVVFNAWTPEPDQLAYVNGATAIVAAAFGVGKLRNSVTPEANVRPRLESEREFGYSRGVNDAQAIAAAQASGLAE